MPMSTAATLQAAETPGPTSESWERVKNLRCEFTVDIPLPSFRIADILRLSQQTVVNSLWRIGEDVPLRVNQEVIAHGEFEVVGDRLAVRLTDLA